MSTEKVTRKGSPPIKVYALPEERQRLQANARASGRSLSSYLLAVGQGYRISGIVDYEQVRELARINGDLGRLGGLLKLWLTQDPHRSQIRSETIRAVLHKIEVNQDALSAIMDRVIRPEKRA